MDTLETIIQLASTLGLGALLGVLIKNFLDRNREAQARLFTARREAYKNVIGRINNFFSERETHGLNRVERRIQMNTFFSDALLLGGQDLRAAIQEYMDRVDDIDTKIDQAPDDQEADRLDDELSLLITRIESMMRKELGVQ
jgi:flagellar motor component MotA